MNDKNQQIPGFGWAARLTRWSQGDRTVTGSDGPLPPPRARSLDKTDDPIGYADPGGMLGLMGGSLNQFASEPRSRLDLYKIYDEMDKTDIAGSVLDLYAEDATQMDPDTGRTVWVRSKSGAVVKAADDLFRRLELEENVTALARDTCKYGDDFERLVYRAGPDGGVQRMLSVHPMEMVRKDNKEGKLEGYSQTGKKYKSAKSPVSYSWDYAHFRLRGHDRRFAYGTSLLKNAVRPWRQMMILEDWMVQYQVSRHPDRNLFILDVGSSSDVDSADVARRFRQKLKRHMIVDPLGTSGQNLNYNFNPILPTEDIVMAVRQNSNTRVEKLTGSGNAADIVPLNYVVTKFFSAVRAPKGFFGFGDGAGGEAPNMKASLCAQDIRYARGCQRVQRALRTGIQWLCEFDMVLRAGGAENPESDGIDFTAPENAFSVHMGPISFLAELERLEVIQLRQQVGVALADMGRDNPAYKASEWTKYILRDIIKVPGRELDRVLRTSDEVLAVQRALLNAKPADVHTAMPTGVGAQTQLAQKQFGLQQDQGELAADQQKHQQRMDKAQMAAQRAADQDEAEEANDDVKRAREAINEVHARGLQSDGDMSKGDLKALSEALGTDSKLRRIIELGALLWREDGETRLYTGGMALPDRNSEAFKEMTEDEVTADDIVAEMGEAAEKSAKAGA